MALWIAALLGVIQGIFMFLPVSSTAHMVLAEHWLIAKGYSLPAPDSAEMILFALVVHVGTLISIIVVFWSSLWRFTRNATEGALSWAGRGGRGGLPLYFRLFLLGLFSVLCTGLLGIAFKTSFEQIFGAPWIIAITLTLTGILLWWTDRLSPRKRGLKKINWKVAGVIGLAQGFALMPGLSRSAMTIMFSLFTGLKRRWAAEYSFFLAIPTILAATLVQAIKVYRLDVANDVSMMALTVGFVVAAMVGIVSLKLVVYFLYRAQLKVFAFYVWLLALAIMLGWIDLGGPHLA
ncbi:undecaprenyl-diphosphatase [Ectothiorhodosinus mongolicus]|uniref:Undecaprenyl-diphosphatase n=1 Tax=Ectothiorhodosinus mongolicus TaxID=233100 RepID=A0A1R3VR83_9GAMM|nr:undecaprenyl-diphosphate phosphatase [Ectothiorhodosinus mongolicus]ULX56627.1 undecaprenyl-diphosphate phosphatase [Ectothiorhodosinus mongolicus]SIT66561.1 undecaprenyl-diphosphatase [Ectothiorhodosinus mongolicus]